MPALVDYDKANALLKKYGIATVGSRYVKSAGDAIAFAGGNSIALKVLSPKAIHKTKSGLIALDLSTAQDITEAYKRLAKKAQKLKPSRMLAQRMVKRGLEIIIGGNIDPQFGKMVLLGLGGIYVETFKDFALRVIPISRYDADSMVNQLKSKNIIAPDSHSEKLIMDLLLKVSRMLENNDIKELDLNPIMLHDGRYDAVDLRILK